MLFRFVDPSSHLVAYFHSFSPPCGFPQNSELSSDLNVTRENHQTTMSPDLMVSNLVPGLGVFLTPWFSPGTFFRNIVVAFSLRNFQFFSSSKHFSFHRSVCFLYLIVVYSFLTLNCLYNAHNAPLAYIFPTSLYSQQKTLVLTKLVDLYCLHRATMPSHLF